MHALRMRMRAARASHARICYYARDRDSALSIAIDIDI
jgi:hypothetical protein